MNYNGTGRAGIHQSAAYTSSAGTVTNVVGNGVVKVRVVTTTAAYVKIANAPTAAATDMYMPADSPEYFTVSQGQKVSAIQVSAAGTLHVTEIL